MRSIVLALALVLGAPTAALADHEYERCYDGWCGSGSDGNTGYDGEGGRSGDTNQNGDDNCRNFCGNTIIIPDPTPGGGNGPQ